MPGSVRDLTLFVAVYEQRSFTGAAERERATQSGVSQHIRKLEDSLGVRLFTRSKGEVQPTPAGDSLYLKCLDILRLYDAAGKAVKSYGKGLEGQLVVGLMPTMTRSVLAPVLARFVEDNPNVAINVIEASSATLTQQVRAAELDFAIVPAFASGPGLNSRLFLRTPEVLVKPQRRPQTWHPRAARQPVARQAGAAGQTQHTAQLAGNLLHGQRR